MLASFFLQFCFCCASIIKPKITDLIIARYLLCNIHLVSRQIHFVIKYWNANFVFFVCVLSFVFSMLQTQRAIFKRFWPRLTAAWGDRPPGPFPWARNKRPLRCSLGSENEYAWSLWLDTRMKSSFCKVFSDASFGLFKVGETCKEEETCIAFQAGPSKASKVVCTLKWLEMAVLTSRNAHWPKKVLFVKDSSTW